MEWIVKTGDQDYRANSLEELQTWYREGRLRPENYVFHPVLQRWLYVRELEELKSVSWGSSARVAQKAVRQATIPQADSGSSPQPSQTPASPKGLFWPGAFFAIVLSIAIISLYYLGNRPPGESSSKAPIEREVAETANQSVENAVKLLADLPLKTELREIDRVCFDARAFGYPRNANLPTSAKTRCANAHLELAEAAVKAKDRENAIWYSSRARDEEGNAERLRKIDKAIGRLAKAPPQVSAMTAAGDSSSRPAQNGSRTDSNRSVLYVAGLEKIVVATSKASFDRWLSASSKRDRFGQVELLARGEIVLVDNNTRVLILDYGFAKHQVRILEGPEEGVVGWVPREWVR